MSLTEDLRAGAPTAFAALYDGHSAPLHTYCHVLLGDQAADAVRDAFVAIARHPDAVPPDEDMLPAWLHALVRAECVRRGAFLRKPATTSASSPIERALAGLQGEDRDVLALSVSLVFDEIAWILDVTPDTAVTLVHDSRRRLEQALSESVDEDTLRRSMRQLYEPPQDQSERVLAACADTGRTADETVGFDADGMPVVPDPPPDETDETDEPALTEPAPEGDTEPAEIETTSHAGRAAQRRRFRRRRIEGLFQTGALAALVFLAVGVMAVGSDRSSPDSSGDPGTSHRERGKPAAGPSVQVVPPIQPTRFASPVVPVAPSPAGPSPDVPLPPEDSARALPPPPPSVSDSPTHHSPTPTGPTPTPSPTPTGEHSPTPDPRGS